MSIISCIDFVLLVGASLVSFLCLFFLIECTAAVFLKVGEPRVGNWENTKIAVLVPAHNEEAAIASTLKKILPTLKTQDRLVVVADNCSDRTAEIASELGAVVTSRHDPVNRGKGYAVDYGLRFLESEPPDVVVLIDADCTVEAGTIAQLTECAIATGRPTQATYLMLRPKNSNSSKDFVSQFSNIVRNLVRLRGLSRLGIPSSLHGTGMAFPWKTIHEVNFANGHLLEDLKLGLDFTIAGHKPIFCPQAQVTAYLPSGSQAAKSQKTRWVHGHLQLIQTYTPILAKEAVSQRRLDLLGTFFDLCVPPLSLLALIWLGMMVSTLLFSIFSGNGITIAIATVGGFCFFTGIVIAWSNFAAEELPLIKLLIVPLYLIWKIPMYLMFLVKPQKLWVRTERDNL